MSALARYGFAALSVLLGTIGLSAFSRIFDVEPAPFFLFTPSVFVAAVVGGFGPGVFATFLGSLAVELVLMRTEDQQGSLELVRLGLFVIIGTGISALARSQKDARALAEDRERLANRRADELASARLAAERSAREAERRAAELEALFNVSPVGLARTDDPECRTITVNHSLARRLGLSAESPPASPAQPTVLTTARDLRLIGATELPLQTAARSRRPVVDAEFATQPVEGRPVLLQGHAVPLLDEQGAVRGALGVFTDVTEHRLAGVEQGFLAEASRLLSGSLDYGETLRRVVALGVPDMADWAVLDVTDAAGRVTRLTAAHRDPEVQAVLEATGLWRRGGFEPPPPTLVAAAHGPVLEPRVTGETLRAWGATEAQVARLAPARIASALAVPLVLHGAAVGVLAWARGPDRTAFDTRDLALAEEIGRRAAMAVEHARLYAEAQSASRMKDEFVATLSHELRTPLNALLGWTDLLRTGRLGPERQRQAIEAIHRAANAQALLTNDLVDISRAVSGKFQLLPREVEFDGLVRAATETFRLAAESKGLWLRCHVAEPLPRVVVDPDRVRQIAYNLVGNAVKFTASGGVDVEASADGDWLVLAVSDTGIGIDPVFLPYVFEPFRQADGSVSREFGGLGLGLSIVRALVQLHGGTVGVHSRGRGQGATFTVRLPLSPPGARRPQDAVAQSA
ncbi:MAG: ATP-binding protein [Vicinamibacterales bacterium]